MEMKRYKVLTNSGDIKTIYRNDSEMRGYLELGLAAVSLPVRSHPWNILYADYDPLYGYYTTDPEGLEECLKAYPTLLRGIELLKSGAVRSEFN